MEMFSYLDHLKRKNKIITVRTTDSIWSVLELMEQSRIGAVIVTDGGKLAGIFTERDLLLNWRNLSTMAIKELPISKIMTKEVQSLSAGKLKKAAIMMLAKKYRHLPILDGAKIVNFLSIRDVLELVMHELDHVQTKLEKYEKAESNESRKNNKATHND